MIGVIRHSLFDIQIWHLATHTESGVNPGTVESQKSLNAQTLQPQAGSASDSYIKILSALLCAFA
jgi:hypothetical protein